MNDRWPAVSVVVPVFNGAATIDECLRSLLASDYPADRLELLCVDNASDDDTGARVGRYAPRVRLLFEAKRGAAAARNCGIRAARFDRIAFTDADCTVDPNWLRHLVAPLADPTIGIVGGRILAHRPANFIERFGETIHDHRRAIEVFKPPYAITMSWASRRDVLEAVGLFDERLLRGQDSELAYRIGQRGLRLVYVDDAVVYHRNESSLWGLFHEGYVHGFHAPRIRALHAAAVGSAGGRQQLARAWRRVLRPSFLNEGEADWRRRLCAHLFNLGKACGETRALASRAAEADAAGGE